MELQFKYLGIPLSNKKMSLTQWPPFFDIVVARKSSWTTKEISYAGRLQVVQLFMF